jgi:hypothetical protein
MWRCLEDPLVNTQILKKLAFLDEGMAPVMAGGVGGAGGYLAGKHIINPLLENQKRSILDKMLRGESMLKKLETGTKIVPLAAATIGALLLAALAASRAKQHERERIQDQLLYAQLQEQLGNSQGFSQANEIPFGGMY